MNEPKDKAVHRGEPFRKYAVEAILLDLIAELRTWDSYYCKALAADLADRAEQRLREVTDDE